MRSFIAIELPQEIKDKLAELQSKLEPLIKGNFVAKNNLHISLKFLGSIGNIAEIEKELLKISKDIKPFNIQIKKLGIFPSENYIRVIWAGAYAPELQELYNKIQTSLEPLGFKKEDHKFHAHITLARVKAVNEKQKLLELIKQPINQSINFGSFTANKISLFKSTLTGKGPIYEEIKKFKFEA